jgi:hypothetical protein
MDKKVAIADGENTDCANLRGHLSQRPGIVGYDFAVQLETGSSRKLSTVPCDETIDNHFGGETFAPNLPPPRA